MFIITDKFKYGIQILRIIHLTSILLLPLIRNNKINDDSECCGGKHILSILQKLKYQKCKFFNFI